MNTQQIRLPFSGFYESSHSQAIDACVERLPDYAGDDNPQAWAPEAALKTIWEGDGINYQAAYQNYAEAYAKAFGRVLVETGGLDLGLSFAVLSSPRFYNFETDKIFCDLGEGKAQALRDAVSDKALQLALNKLFTPYDGFIPFYTRDLEEWKAKPTEELDHNELYAYLMAHIAEVYLGGVGDDTADIDKAGAELGENIWDVLHDSSPTAADDAVEAGLTAAGKAAMDEIYAAYEKHTAKPGKMGAVEGAF